MSTVSIMKDNIMQRECATIATIKMEEQKNHGNANTKNCMPTVYAKIAILTDTTRWRDKSIKTVLNPMNFLNFLTSGAGSNPFIILSL